MAYPTQLPHLQVRQDNDTLDSSPFPIVLQLSAELWAELEGTMSRHPSAPALAVEDTCRRMAQIVSNLVHCEVVFPDGRQVTLYTRDVPHAVPIPPLEVYPLQATRDRRVSLTVQRSLPLSSAHGNSEFRLAILFNAPRSGAIGEGRRRCLAENRVFMHPLPCSKRPPSALHGSLPRARQDGAAGHAAQAAALCVVHAAASGAGAQGAAAAGAPE